MFEPRMADLAGAIDTRNLATNLERLAMCELTNIAVAHVQSKRGFPIWPWYSTVRTSRRALISGLRRKEPYYVG